MNAILFFILFQLAQLFGWCPQSEMDKMSPEQHQIICEIVDADDGGA